MSIQLRGYRSRPQFSVFYSKDSSTAYIQVRHSNVLTQIAFQAKGSPATASGRVTYKRDTWTAARMYDGVGDNRMVPILQFSNRGGTKFRPAEHCPYTGRALAQLFLDVLLHPKWPEVVDYKQLLFDVAFSVRTVQEVKVQEFERAANAAHHWKDYDAAWKLFLYASEVAVFPLHKRAFLVDSYHAFEMKSSS